MGWPKGRRQPAATKAKIASALKGRPRPPEVRAKISASKMGHATSPETRGKISRALAGRPLDEKRRAILIEANRSRVFTMVDRVNLSLRAMMTDKIGPLRAKLAAEPALEALRRARAAEATKARHAAARAERAARRPEKPILVAAGVRAAWTGTGNRRRAAEAQGRAR